jgi:hypothetical protein
MGAFDREKSEEGHREPEGMVGEGKGIVGRVSGGTEGVEGSG